MKVLKNFNNLRIKIQFTVVLARPPNHLNKVTHRKVRQKSNILLPYFKANRGATIVNKCRRIVSLIINKNRKHSRNNVNPRNTPRWKIKVVRFKFTRLVNIGVIKQVTKPNNTSWMSLLNRNHC